jgi:hypothetical protein
MNKVVFVVLVALLVLVYSVSALSYKQIEAMGIDALRSGKLEWSEQNKPTGGWDKIKVRVKDTKSVVFGPNTWIHRVEFVQYPSTYIFIIEFKESNGKFVRGHVFPANIRE